MPERTIDTLTLVSSFDAAPCVSLPIFNAGVSRSAAHKPRSVQVVAILSKHPFFSSSEMSPTMLAYSSCIFSASTMSIRGIDELKSVISILM